MGGCSESENIAKIARVETRLSSKKPKRFHFLCCPANPEKELERKSSFDIPANVVFTDKVFYF